MIEFKTTSHLKANLKEDYVEYEGIFIVENPFKDEGLPYMIEAPDIESFADTLEHAKQAIDQWVLINGSVEWYTAKQDRKLGWR